MKKQLFALAFSLLSMDSLQAKSTVMIGNVIFGDGGACQGHVSRPDFAPDIRINGLYYCSGVACGGHTKDMASGSEQEVLGDKATRASGNNCKAPGRSHVEMNFDNEAMVVGSGNVVEKEVALPYSIQDINISGIGALIIKSGDKASLVVQAEENIHKYLTQSIYDESSLDLSFVKNRCSFKINKPIRYILTVSSSVRQIKAQGSTIVEIDSLSSSEVDLNASGNSRICANKARSNRLSVFVSGASSVEIEEGNVISQFVKCSGASQYNASNMNSESSFVDLSGASSASVYSSKSATGYLSGSSQLDVDGNPQFKRFSTSGCASYRI
jgi:hypothetical protein